MWLIGSCLGFSFPLDECYQPLSKSRSLDVDGEERLERAEGVDRGRDMEKGQ